MSKDRLDLCRALGQEPKKALGTYETKNRYWVIVTGANCCYHAGAADAHFICETHTFKEHLVHSKPKQVESEVVLREAFASLTEVKYFWNTLFPGVEPTTLDTCCGKLKLDG